MNTVLRPVGPFSDSGPQVGHRSEAGSADRVETWRDMLREHFVALDVADTDRDAPFTGGVRSALVGHLSASVVTSSPQSCVRTPSLARTDPRTYLQVGMVAEGRAVLEQDGRETVLDPGSFAVYETDRPFSWHFDAPWKLLVLTWPREAVDLDPDLTRTATARALGGDRFGATVGHTLAATVLAPPPDPGGHQLAGELSALLGLAVEHASRRGEEPSAGHAAALRRRVEAYIAEHLEDPDLGPERIARAHFVSVRALHRVFADEDTTVAALIRRRRLEFARCRLLDPHDGDRTLTEIAHGCGFGDLAAFSRRFKIAYHESPGSYRRRASAHGR